MDFDLNKIASWASILSLGISVVSLLLIRSVRANIIKFRRKQRIKQLCEDVMRIPDDAIPLSGATKSKLKSLSNNLPSGILFFVSQKSKAAKSVQDAIKSNDIGTIKEALQDWVSFSEDI